MSPGETFVLQKILKAQICLKEDEVWVYHGGCGKWVKKVADAHPVSGRLRYRFGKTRSTVYKNRLVWMLIHKRPIPDGNFVDHGNGDRRDDDPDNLSLMGQTESHSQGQNIQKDRVLAMLSRYFQFVGQHLREPETSREISWVEVGF